MTEDNDPEADFWIYVADAHNAGEDVDNFDLRSEDPASTARFHELVGAANEAAVELIEYVVKHKEKLLEKLKGEA